MNNTAMQICNETIHPGESLSLALPLPELFTCSPVYMNIKIIHGKQAGPCLLLTAAMHGDALNGTEIINRLLKSEALKNIKGTLIAVPVLNVYGFMNRSRYLPGGINLDSCFPGSSTGTHAARMADLFVTEIFNKADMCIDFQTGFINYTNLPQVFIDFQDEKSKKLAEIFNAPVISNISYEKGMLRTVARNQKKPFLLYEAGEAMRFDEHAIRTGITGVLNIMQHLEMIAEHPVQKVTELKSFFSEKNLWLRAAKSGISHTQYQLGQHIQKDEILCVIQDPFGSDADYVVKSPEEAVIVGKNNLPLVHEGEALFQLAVFSKMHYAATHLESWEEKHTELSRCVKITYPF